jgi:hypothetical protein
MSHPSASRSPSGFAESQNEPQSAKGKGSNKAKSKAKTKAKAKAKSKSKSKNKKRKQNNKQQEQLDNSANAENTALRTTEGLGLYSNVDDASLHAGNLFTADVDWLIDVHLHHPERPLFAAASAAHPAQDSEEEDNILGAVLAKYRKCPRVMWHIQA